MPGRAEQSLLPIGTLTKPHGIRGAIRIACSPEHVEFLAGMPTVHVNGRPLQVRDLRGIGGTLVLEFEGVDDRNGAEELRGATVHARREELPELEEDEYFLADLEGLEAWVADERVGVVTRAQALPANVVLTVTLDTGGDILAPFVHDAVPVVDLEAGRVELDADFLGLGDA